MLNKKSFIFFVVIINIIIFICSAINVLAQEDEATTFKSLAPDALIVLDLSGSMDFNPAGGDRKYGATTACTPNPTACCTSTDLKENGYCSSSKDGCDVDCRRVTIAKKALFSILDDNNDNVIDSKDSDSLNIRIGYMRFTGGNDTSGDYNNGAIKLVTKISALGAITGTPYQTTYCGNGASSSCSPTSTCGSGTECIAKATASSGTPLTSALKEAKKYLDDHKNYPDPAKDCRLKFVILITDGADTYACSGSGSECDDHMYKRRREVVAAAKQLSDAGYKVFVVGFGATMPDYLEKTLNWIAYYGGTDNPLVDNSGSTTDYNIPLGCNANPAVPTACCNLSTNPTACYPAGVTSCQTDSSHTNDTTYCGTPSDPNLDFRASNNDPGYLPLSGYAFIAGNADQLTEALKTAFGAIKDATYSFTQASVQAVRTVDENYLYEASFQPLNYDPFWIGHLKRYSIQTNGNISNTVDWDAGEVLSGISGNTRTILTYKAGSLIAFDTNLTPADLGVTTTTARDTIVNFIRNGETSQDVTAWKLGDIFHTSPLSIATPNSLFIDIWDKSAPKAFNIFRDGDILLGIPDHIRKSTNGKRLILVGDNDGQLHAFQTGESALTGGTGGKELWSFIPPNLLSQLTYTAHSTHPTALIHKYFVDGPLSAAEVWLGTGGDINTQSKSVSDWHTYLVMGEGRGGSATMWSSSTSCVSGFSAQHSSTYVNYCGYYAFDISNTTIDPVFKWRLGGNTGFSTTDSTDRAHLGQPWSKMFIGRVRINNTEKWVGLIGGGFSGVNCPATGTCDTKGKGFYVVDMSNGSILWRYTHSGPTGPANGSMDFDLAAGPVAVDSDNDGFLDTAYIGDLSGNVWRFKFCLASDATSCTYSNWAGGLLFSSPSTSLSMYSSVAVTIDPSQNLWVYFGTGDRTDPTFINTTQEKFYAIKDNDRNRTTPYTLSDLTPLGSTGTYTDSSTGHGWYINLASGGEKMLSEPVLFQKSIYFTTFTPPNNLCDQSGVAKLYILDYITGGGAFASNARSENIGTGIPNAPVISRNPYGGTDIYVSTSQVTSGAHTVKTTDPTVWPYPPNNLIYWRDTRLQ